MQEVILAYNQNVNKDGIADLIEKELIANGKKVISLAFPFQDFKYRNIVEKLKNTFVKNILRDKFYKRKLRFSRFEEEFRRRLDEINHIESAIVIGVDNYPIEAIKKIREKSNNLYAFQWDGVDMFPLTKKMIPYFDLFYCFDPLDEVKYRSVYKNIRFLPNFYFDKLPLKNQEIRKDVFYLGGEEEGRLESLKKIVELSVEQGFSTDFNLKYVSNITFSEIKPIREKISFLDYLVKVQKSKVLLDLQNKLHKGFTFRVMESIGYDKKLITTNPLVEKFDFFNKNNIIVWDGKSKIDLKEFLETPYEPLPEEVKYKYSFENWYNVITQQSKLLIENPLYH